MSEILDDEVIIAESSGDFAMAPAGNHIAICVGMVVLGTVTTTFQGHQKKQKKVMVFFELVNTDNNGKPFVVTINWTLNMSSKSNMRKMLVAWRGIDFTADEAKAFNIAKLIGAHCMCNVIVEQSKSSDNKYNKIVSIAQVPQGTAVKEQRTQKIYFNMLAKTFENDKFTALPEWIQKKIKESDEYKALSTMPTSTSQPVAQPTVGTGGTNKLPF
jgi:hypothetical protein